LSFRNNSHSKFAKMIKTSNLLCLIASILLLSTITNARVRMSENDGWTYLTFDDGVIQNAVKCTAPEEIRKLSECRPDPTQVKLAYTRGVIALAPVYVDVVNNNKEFHRDFKALFLGLGLGVMPRFLNHYLPNIEMEVVELDPEVVQIISTYVSMPASVNIYTQDALQFVNRQSSLNDRVRSKYDLIVHDAFGTYGPVEELNTIPFYMGLMKLLEGGRSGLSENGLVIANVWCVEYNYTRSVAELYAEVFSYVRVLGLGSVYHDEKNCFVLAHTPKADKVTVTCVDGRCKKPKTGKKLKKNKSPICSDTTDIVSIVRSIQDEINPIFNFVTVMEEIHAEILFTDDPRFC